ncbi:MAG: Spy/CpxP family protein refolding chaperone [Alphaproteobacteria bacterium]|nr:Spy/CpxP family protein refolding chaperone [Alphaproteobacteria bacterium]
MRTLLLTTALIAVATTALAQTPPSAPAPAPDAPRRAGMERMCADMDARTAARLAFAEVKVAPTDAQRAAWDMFGREARAAIEPLKRLCGDAVAPRPTDYAGRLAMREKHMSAMLENTRAMRAAVDKLLPALSEEQRTRFSESMDRGRGMGGRGGHHGHH